MMGVARTPAIFGEGRPIMDPSTLDERASDQMHLLLAERGSSILPEAGNEDGRVRLTDAMLAVAALAPCFAMARTSIALGLASLVVALPALARTHVVMVRRRGLGESPGLGSWLFAFVSSTIRVGLILGLIAVIQAASLTVGGFLEARFVGGSSFVGALVGFLVLATPLTLLALAYLVPRLLSVRESG
jgi:hypothetical protein